MQHIKEAGTTYGLYALAVIAGVPDWLSIALGIISGIYTLEKVIQLSAIGLAWIGKKMGCADCAKDCPLKWFYRERWHHPLDDSETKRK